ncbi:MAG: homocysteine S-methyltransferase family protein [Thermoanaerobaculia bacterium]
MNADFPTRLRSGPPLLLDSAMGTELERRGMELDLPLWSARALVEDPDLVYRVHRDNVTAGADVLTANTFRTQRGTLEAAGVDPGRAPELTRLAVALARRAADESERAILVAGSAAPLADCYRPDLVGEPETLAREHAAHVENLREAGVDLVLIETMNTVREARAAVGAVGRRLPVVVSFVTDGQGILLSGEPLQDAVKAALPFRPAAIGVNCVSSRSLGPEIERIARAAPGVPVAAYANNLSDGAPPEEYVAFASGWIRLGARMVGGCCGTTPEHVAALRETLAP